VDECSDCVGSDVDVYNGNKDCAGVCDGDATSSYYYFDYDGDGDGSIPYGHICSADFDGVQATLAYGLVLTQGDADDSCASNSYDECGVCDGDNTAANCEGLDNWNAIQCTLMDCSGTCNGIPII
jgi:hypothetical protein